MSALRDVCFCYNPAADKSPALDSMQHGFSPFVVREACGDRHEAVNDSNLFDMDQKFAEVVLEKEMMEMIDAWKKA